MIVFLLKTRVSNSEWDILRMLVSKTLRRLWPLDISVVFLMVYCLLVISLK